MTNQQKNNGNMVYGQKGLHKKVPTTMDQMVCNKVFSCQKSPYTANNHILNTEIHLVEDRNASH